MNISNIIILKPFILILTVCCDRYLDMTLSVKVVFFQPVLSKHRWQTNAKPKVSDLTLLRVWNVFCKAWGYLLNFNFKKILIAVGEKTQKYNKGNVICGLNTFNHRLPKILLISFQKMHVFVETSKATGRVTYTYNITENCHIRFSQIDVVIS